MEVSRITPLREAAPRCWGNRERALTDRQCLAYWLW